MPDSLTRRSPNRHLFNWMPTLRRHLPPLAIWSVLCALFFATLLLGQERLPSGDFSGQFHAFGLFQARELTNGRFPLWSPGSFAGFPFAADTQAAAFYPPRLLTIFLAPSFPLHALEIEVIVHIWFAGLFTYLLAYDLTQQRTAALIAAVSFGLGGYLTSYPMLQVALLESVIWLPLVLRLIRKGVGEAGEQSDSTPHAILGTRPFILAGLALTLSALAGHPQTFLHVSYAAAAYFLFLTIRAGWHWGTILKAGLLVGGIGVGAASIALVPAFHLMLNSTRSDVTYAFISNGIPLQDYLQFLLPGTLSFWVPQYAGFLTFFLALTAWLGRKQLAPRHASFNTEMTFWIVLAVVAAWLALGDAGILFQAWVKIAPGFSLFRQQERLLGVVALALALLAAQGWVVLTALDAGQRRALLRKAALLCGGILFLGGLYLLADPQQTGKPWPLIWLRQLLILVTVFGLLSYGLGHGRAAFVTALLLLVLGVDLYAGTYASVNRQPYPPDAFWPEPAWLQGLKAELPPLARIDSRGLFFANLGPIFDLEDLSGQSPLRPQLIADFGVLSVERRWQLLGVSHVLAYGSPSPELIQAGVIDANIYPNETMQARIFRVPDPLPRAWMVYQPLLAENPNTALARLADPAFDPATQLILTDANAPPVSHSPAVVSQVEVARQDSRTLLIDVITESPGYLVVSEWAYPGWRAALDGDKTPLYTADYALQAVWVPAGTHQIELQFRPWDVTLGAAVTLLTLVVAVFMSTRELRLSLRQAQGGLIDDLRLAPGRLPLVGGIGRATRQALQSLSVHRIMLYAPYLVTALTLLAFLLRLLSAGSQELRGDEAYSFPFIQIPFMEVIPTLAPVGEEHAPLHYLILNLWSKLSGDSELALRFPAIVPGVLVVPLMYQLGKRIHGRKLGLFLALMLTFSQSAVWLGQDVRNQYVGSILLTGLTTLLFIRACAAPRSVLPWLYYALACALTMYTHYYSVFALLAHGLFLVAIPAYRRYLWRWLGAGGVAAALFAPWFLATIGGWAGQLDAPPGDPPQLAAFLVTVGRELTIGPAFGYSWGRWLFLAALLLCLYGFSLLWRKQRAWAVVLGGWLGLTALGVFLVALRRNIFNDYYIAPATVAWWSLIGMAVVALWRQGGWRRGLAMMSTMSFMAAAILSLSHYYGDPITYGRNQGARELAEHIITNYQPGDVFVSNFPDPILPYYLRHSPIPKVLQPLEQGEPHQVTETGVAQLAAQYERLWFLPSSSSWDPEQVASAWLDYHTLIEQDLTFTNLQLVAYRPEAAVDEVIEPIEQTFIEKIVLEGAYLTVNGVPADLSQPVVTAPGSTLALTLVWNAAMTTPNDYTVLVHLLAPDGFLLAQGDGIPLFGTRPTSTWQMGERLLDRHTFTVPENLELNGGRLVVGLYDPITSERLLVGPDRDVIMIGQIDVQ